MKKLLFILIILITSNILFAENIGLVLSGGGAKGAYEVGAWKALNDLGISDRITVISGTSVGAINASFFACETPDKIEELWRNQVGFETFLMPDSNTITSILSFMIEKIRSGIGETNEKYNQTESDSFIFKLKKAASTAGAITVETLKSLGLDVLEYCKEDTHAEGLFQRDTLEEILDRYVSLEKIRNSPYKVYATTIRKRWLKTKAFASKFVDWDSAHSLLLNEQVEDSYIHQIVLASSALPICYDSQPIAAGLIENGSVVKEQYEYIDGGFAEIGGQNTPYKPVLKEDVDTIIVIYLQSENEMSETDSNGNIVPRTPLISPEALGNRKLVEIVPSEDLGNMIHGTVNFSSDKVSQLIELGYDDTVKVISEYLSNY